MTRSSYEKDRPLYDGQDQYSNYDDDLKDVWEERRRMHPYMAAKRFGEYINSRLL